MFDLGTLSRSEGRRADGRRPVGRGALAVAGSVAAAIAAGCGGSGGAGASAPGEAPLLPGYVRYHIEPITVMPGEAIQNLEWVGMPLDHEAVVEDVLTEQGPAGHHAIIFTTAETRALGYRRPSDAEDMAKMQILGGAFGARGAQVKPPPGTVLFVRPGRFFVIQTHWINATEAPVATGGYIDVKLGPPKPGLKVASAFGFPLNDISIQPHGETTLVRSCPVPVDLPILMLANHMHAYGVRAVSELEDGPNGTTVLKEDPVWNPEWTTAPNFDIHPAESPLMLHAGQRVRVTCVWKNDTNNVITYPDEMCVFFGYYLGATDVSGSGCVPVSSP